MKFSALQAGAFLHHIRLLSPAPERLAKFYGTAMDMDVTKLDQDWLCAGPRRRLIIGTGKSNNLAYGALACRDADALARLRDHVVMRGVQVEPSPSTLFDGRAFGVRDHDNNLILFGVGLEEAGFSTARLHGPIQHLTLATHDLHGFEDFYLGKLGFSVTDRVRDQSGRLTTSFTTCNHEHHTIAAFLSDRQGVDHHSYEAGECVTLRNWCDRLAEQRIPIMWGPGRHGPGNNLFAFFEDPDRNWIEISAELEVIYDRPVKDWPHESYTLNRWGNAIMRA